MTYTIKPILRSLVMVLISLAAAALAPTASAENSSLSLVTRADGVSGAPANDYSAAMAASRNGRFIAFYSYATNLGFENAGLNGYLRDTVTGKTTLFGRADGPDGELADAEIYPGGVSDDGRYVSFTSYATNLSPDAQLGYDPGMWPEGNVYVRDLCLNKTILVSRAAGASGAGANGMSFGDSISANGRYVAFNSASTNLVPGASSIGPYGWPTMQTYVRDLVTNAVKLASRKTGSNGAPADADSLDATSISANGRYVLFQSDGSNLSTIDQESVLPRDAFVRDMSANTTQLVSRRDGNGPGFTGYTLYAQLSGDGMHAAVSVVDGGMSQVWARDVATKHTELISRASASAGNASADDQAYGWSLSSNGRYIAWSSEGDNLDASADPAQRNVFVRDRTTGQTVLVSRLTGADGAGADGYSDNGFISNDGSSVTFNTFASNLLSDDIDDAFAMKAVKATVTYP